MVQTGARAAALERPLEGCGLRVRAAPIAPPRLSDLTAHLAAEIMALYRAMGGRATQPSFRPGPWDFSLGDGSVVELDEELHFNRYRAVTLRADWAIDLPWGNDCLDFCMAHERDCLSAGKWGKRWTNSACEAMFGPGDPPGVLNASGAPRWKQRALYDAIRDAAALSGHGPRVARLATQDIVGRARVGSVLDGRATSDRDGFIALLGSRTT